MCSSLLNPIQSFEIQKLAEENLLADKLFVEEVSQLAEVQKDVDW